MYKFYVVQTYQNRRGLYKSKLVLNSNSTPLCFETNDLSYSSVKSLIDSNVSDSIKGYPIKTSLFSLHSEVHNEFGEWVSSGHEYKYSPLIDLWCLFDN